LLQAVKQAYLKYAVFLKKECKQALLEKEERKMSEQAKEAEWWVGVSTPPLSWGADMVICLG